MLCKARGYVHGSDSGSAGFIPTLYSSFLSLLAPQPLVEGERDSEAGTLTRLHNKTTGSACCKYRFHGLNPRVSDPLGHIGPRNLDFHQCSQVLDSDVAGMVFMTIMWETLDHELWQQHVSAHGFPKEASRNMHSSPEWATNQPFFNPK